MLGQYRHQARQVACQPCAGCVDPGEQPQEAARRELLEKTGYRLRREGVAAADDATGQPQYPHQPDVSISGPGR